MARDYGRRAKKNLLRKLLALVAVLTGVCLVMVVLLNQLEEESAPVYGDLDARFESETVSWNGRQYIRKPDLSTFLLIGVDQMDSRRAYNGQYRSGGQSDFLLLVVIDPQQKKINRIHIDRDTMADVTVLGVLGDNLGTSRMQICLAHGFGDGEHQSNQFTVDAVSRLLSGIDIDGYYAMNMSGISRLNDLLGGVTVLVEDDFSAYDASMTPGTVVRLHGEQTELFVRSRMPIGDEKNSSRMKRQQQFMKNATALVVERMDEDKAFFGELLDGITPYTVSNIARGRLINEANRAAKYTVGEILTPEGVHADGEDGFVEFHADEAALMQLALDVFYEPAQ